MRYSATHKQATRAKLIASSRAIAKRDGFEAAGVDGLMAAIGLSGGAFYNHFASKDELFAALVECEMAHSTVLLAGADAADPDAIVGALRRYLTSAHASQPEAGCALPALGAEIARADVSVRSGVEQSLRKLQRAWRDRLAGDGDRAWALIAQCVGAILLARVVASGRTRGEILASNRRFAEQAANPPPRVLQSKGKP